MIENLAYGALAGAPFVVAAWFASPLFRLTLSLIALVAMVSIYVGSHLTSSAPDRILIEVAFALVVSGLGLALLGLGRPYQKLEAQGRETPTATTGESH